MFAKTALVCALLAASVQVAFAQTVVQPACLMKVLSSFQTETPGHYAADQKTLCCKEAAEVKSRIQSNLCPSGDQAAALSSYKTACEEAGYGSCSNSTTASTSSSSSASVSGTASPSGHSNSSAPYPLVYTSTSTYFDKDCSCTKTTALVGSISSVAGATGFATATGTGTGASGPFATSVSGSGSGSASGSGSGSGLGSGSGTTTGSPIIPVSPSKTGSGPSFTGAATKNVGSVAAGLLAVAGIAMAL